MTRRHLPNLPRESMPWGREVNDRFDRIERALEIRDQGETNTNKQQNSTASLLSRQIVALDAKVQEAFDNLTVDAVQVASGVLDPDRVPTLDESKVSGTWTKAVSTAAGVQGATGTFHGGIHSLDARNFVVTTNYAASWIDVNGHLGISPSTRRFKKNVIEWTDEDTEALFSIRPMKYHLSIPDRTAPELDENGDQIWDEVPVLDGDEVVDVEYVPRVRVMPGFEDEEDAPLRIGFIAEDLVKAGLTETVVFDEDGLPVSINYAEWVVPLQMEVRWLHDARTADRKEIDELRSIVTELTSRLEKAGI